MEISDPISSAALAALMSAAYVHVTSEGELPNSAYIKPATLTGIMVYVLMSNGAGTREKIMTGPY